MYICFFLSFCILDQKRKPVIYILINKFWHFESIFVFMNTIFPANSFQIALYFSDENKICILRRTVFPDVWPYKRPRTLNGSRAYPLMHTQNFLRLIIQLLIWIKDNFVLFKSPKRKCDTKCISLYTRTHIYINTHTHIHARVYILIIINANRESL